MKMSEIYAMSTDDLKALALKKGRNGNASSAALMAQKELVRRNGGAVAGHHFDGLYFLSDDSHERFTKKFKCRALEDV